ncbi:hypothetical protein [Acinetobacter sp.]|uniref:hypothetical protein n=1 Tax=Acinetobacter sp. TaxID=472 RepID=UPI00388E80D6
MATSNFGAAFDKLHPDIQLKIARALQTRKLHYIEAMRRGYNGMSKVVIIGDTPGPGRPTTPGYHHTPFYSTKNSSLWVNRLLAEADIDERALLWFNAELADGKALNPIHVQDLMRLNPTFIVLGGNAEKWFKMAAPGVKYVKVYHPQFAKRFKSKEPYALIDEIKKAIV